MKVIDEDKIAFLQGGYNDDMTKVLQELMKRCSGVDKIIVVKRPDVDDHQTTLFTFWFKGHNGKRYTRHTFSTELTK